MDRSQFTTGRSLLSLLAAPKRKLIITGQPGEIREFIAVALTDGVPLEKDLYKRYAKNPDSLASVSTSSARFVLKAKIVADARGTALRPEQNPHRFLLDPCKYGSSADVNTTLRIIKLYTTYISGANFNQAGGNQIRTGDTIRVAMAFNRNGKLILEQGEILSLVEPSQNNSLLDEECINLSGVFDTTSVSSLAGMDFGSRDLSLDDSVCEEGYDEFYLVHPLQTDAYGIGSPFSPNRDNPTTEEYDPVDHKGADIGAPANVPIYAAADGKVTTITNQTYYTYKDSVTNERSAALSSCPAGQKCTTGGAGNYVAITHENGYYTMYFHMIELPTMISVGQTVKAGDLIGNVGSTGASTGPHLHFELRQSNGTAIDPIPYIKTLQKCNSTTPETIASADPTNPQGVDG